MTTVFAQKLAQLVIPLIATAILSSCASDGGGFGSPLPSKGEVKPLPPYDPFGTGEKSNPGSENKTGQNTVAKSQVASVAPPATPRASAPPIDGGATLSPFAGMSPEELRAQWGKPSLTRNEAGAQLWQFQGKNCVVLAYLYPSAGGGLETAYAEAHPGGDSANAVSSCLGKSVRTSEAVDRGRKPELIVKPD